jgi:hypothetical protein
MVYALILSLLACVLAVVAFSLVAQPALWFKLWNRRRQYIIAQDTAAAAYSHTGIRLRLALVGVILACGAMVIPIAFAAADVENVESILAESPNHVPAASTVSEPPPVSQAPRPELPEQVFLPETQPAHLQAEVPVRREANNIPSASGLTDRPPCLLPAAQDAVPYASAEEARREIDPTLGPPLDAEAISLRQRGANNRPDIP